MSKFHSLTVSNVKNETRDTIVVTFDVPQELQYAYRYIHGQHLTLRAKINDEDVRRSYSICSGVQENKLRVAIKRTPGGVFSTWANDTIKPGGVLDVMPPMGHFHTPLKPDSKNHYLAFAAGSGITPMLSIIKTTLVAEPKSMFTLFYGNRASSSVIFKEDLAELKDQYLDRFKLVYVMSREQQDIELFNGRINKEKCEQLFKSWVALEDVDMAFVCGPEQMMHEVSDALESNGLSKDKIKIELFATSVPRRQHVSNSHLIAGSHDCEVTLIIDGAHVNFTMEKDKESVLEAALKQGIDMRYSCKAGVCSTCRCKVLDGKVDMDANYALEDYEVARGFALSCQSFPVTDKLVMDFDQDH
jgi:ring-1,2-phenylacetyl-CoA epoxidase subunit PaaE